MATGDKATFELSARQLWAMIALLVSAMGGTGTYVGRTASDLGTSVAVLTHSVKSLRDQVKRQDGHATQERQDITARLHALSERLRQAELELAGRHGE